MSGCVEEEEENVVLLEQLPTEILVVIFNFCTVQALGNICQTCKRLNSVVKEFIWSRKSQKALATNQISSDIQNRSSHLLSPGSKCRISTNWLRGRYEERVYYPFRSKHLPWLVLDRETLWLSKGMNIEAMKRRRSGGLSKSPCMTLNGHSDDVCRFVQSGDLIVSGGRDGTVCGWLHQTGELQFRHSENPSVDVMAVGVCGDVVVSGLHNGTVCMRNLSDHVALLKIPVHDYLWSLALQPLGSLCCVGTAAHRRVPPLQLYDLEQGQEVIKLDQKFRDGAGVLDIHWESHNEFLSGGYDTYLRLWDIRTGRNVQTWEDPYDCTIYSIASDNMFTILCGMSLHGRVHFWDKRQRRDIGMFFMNTHKRSPVFSLAFDPCELFTVLDLSLHVLDFSVFKETSNGNHMFHSSLLSFL